ncbi:MAG: hypothetical protein Q8Q11_01850 [bacterium]|nr:hypothetical protein [bacterium]MDZ4248363.1 hypothetical protein [Patescibacteria group bacterium]
MSIRTILWGLGFVAAACWIAWVLTVVNNNPDQGGQTVLLSFYISLYVALVSTFTVGGFALRRYFGNNELRYAYLQASFRQAFIVGALLIALLALQSVRLLAWWDILLLVAVSLLLELYLRSNARSQRI